MAQGLEGGNKFFGAIVLGGLGTLTTLQRFGAAAEGIHPFIVACPG